jgi:hypothetical protein
VKRRQSERGEFAGLFGREANVPRFKRCRAKLDFPSKQLRRPSHWFLHLSLDVSWLNVVVFYALQTLIQVKRVAETSARLRPPCVPSVRRFASFSVLALRFTLKALIAFTELCAV